ncbi:hypothetical protein [Ekhidna sp.]|uniref:ParE family toxin-like protein n=1 Tax=Ekhidna sp. TaxID=2608089 RepID=UPI003B50A710
MQKLPIEVQNQAADSYILWKENPNHPSLRFKKIHASLPIYSVRISLSYRAIGKLEDDTLIWFWIGNHNDYDQLINQLK